MNLLQFVDQLRSAPGRGIREKPVISVGKCCYYNIQIISAVICVHDARITSHRNNFDPISECNG